jgi:hypothetical protein
LTGSATVTPMSDAERTAGEFVESLPVGETVAVDVNGETWLARRLPEVSEPTAWYLAVCRDCGGMIQPFRDRAARDEWAAGHEAGTGHEVRKASHA